MASSLTDFDVDLLNEIGTKLEPHDHINLMSTSWHFRMLLGSKFFKIIKASEKSRNSVFPLWR